MWEIKKRQAFDAASSVCTFIVACVALMFVSAYIASLLPKSVSGIIYGSAKEVLSDPADKTHGFSEEITVIDKTGGLFFPSESADCPEGSYVIEAVNLARYTKSQKPQIFVLNQTNYTVNTDDCLKGNPPAGSVFGDMPTVLIYHTHGTESYATSGIYDDSTPFRSEDISKNVVAVGEEFASELEKLGVKVIHDKNMYDKDGYGDSYTKSAKAVRDALKEYPSIRYVIDIHRDSVVVSDKQVKLISYIEGDRAAQVMIVVGTDSGGGVYKWLKNFTSAVKLQASLNEMYPTLARPIYLRSSSFNQEFSPGAMLLEIGSCGNTLEEALAAAKYTARAMAEAFK